LQAGYEFYIAKAYHVGLSLLEPKAHVHFAIHCDRGREIPSGVLRLTAAVIEPAQAEVAMGNEWAHPVALGDY